MSDRERQISYYLHVVESKNMIQMNLFKNRNRFADIENNLMVTTKGEG